MRKIYLVAILCSLFPSIFGLGVRPVWAKNKAEIVDVFLEHENTNFEVSFRIHNCFTPKMEEAIRSGVRTNFRILMVIEGKGLPFLKPKLLDVAFEHSLKYDRLENEYVVQLDEYPGRILTTTDFDEAKQWMSTVSNLPIIPLWRLESGKEYQFRVKAELSKVHLPLFLRYIFYFVSLWDFETGWRKVPFSY